jgi:hypothetical protein
MRTRGYICLIAVSSLVWATAGPAGAADPPWKDKPINQWTVEEAKQVLTDSPWEKSVNPTMERSPSEGRSRGGGMGRGGGIGMGGGGMGIPGMGGGGMGRRGGGYGGGGGQTPPTVDPSTPSMPVPTLMLRWESALPVRAAEMKTGDANAPSVDEDHYAIAVYGYSGRSSDIDPDSLKKQARIKRQGKKDLKPSSVDVLQRDNDTVFVYLFPKSNEIGRNDKVVKFEGKIGRLQFAQAFELDDMVFAGKLEL